MASDFRIGSPQIGYLSILSHAEFGYFGGFLTLDSRGRPLEFHCTAPVRPSRAQEILFGPSLRPYLMSELIGGTLLDKAKLKPPIILTDQLDALCLASQSVMAIACAVPGGSDCDQAILKVAAAENDLPQAPTARIQAGRYDFELALNSDNSAAEVIALLNGLSGAFDLVEPFDRIREAIGEAQRITTSGPSDIARAG